MYVGNVLTVFAVIVLGLVVYNGLNLVAPESIGVPVPTLLALLTGLAMLVPLVVGKIVYVPVGVYLAYSAATGSGPLWFPRCSSSPASSCWTSCRSRSSGRTSPGGASTAVS